jgi:hypothetical protein
MSESDDHGWDRGFEGHSTAQLRRLARLSLIEKLVWLEEAQRTVESLRKSRAGEVRDADRDA